ncbi:MAG: exodeoxyribonuclease III [Bacteriovorax sp.]
MIISSWNVNGLRSVSSKGFQDWFMKYLPDVIALQEIKANEADVKSLLNAWQMHYESHLFPATKKGYSGTALLVKNASKQKPISIVRGLEMEEFDSEGRLIWAEFDKVIVMNGYFPNGQRDHSRVDYKLDFSRKVVELAHKLHQETKKEIIITGDLNTAHREIDLANPKSNGKTTGFLPHERAFLDEMIEGGFTDVFRHLHPEEPHQYTWWTYRGDCRERNIGWRLDYFFATKGLLKNIANVHHQVDVLGSDHCPIIMEIKD